MCTGRRTYINTRLVHARSVSSWVCRVIHHHYGMLHHVNCSCLPQFSFFLNLSVTCWLAVGRLLVTCRSTDGRQVFWGALLHNYRNVNLCSHLANKGMGALDFRSSAFVNTKRSRDQRTNTCRKIAI